MKKIKVAVMGASGYAGLELVRLLSRHPGVTLTTCSPPGNGPASLSARSSPPWPASATCPSSPRTPRPSPPRRQVVFTSVPHQTAMALVPQLLARDCKVVDLSADFRFKDAAVYEQCYQAHSAKDLLAEAVYGLPEIHGYAVSRARLVGNPGCYPTGVILGLAPLIQNRLVCLDSLIADCKSGVSGAGRQAGLATQFCEVNDGFKAYKVAEHRHNPEMEQELSLLAGEQVLLTFAPHLVPMSRGILGDPLRPAGEAHDRSGAAQLLPELLCRSALYPAPAPRGFAQHHQRPGQQLLRHRREGGRGPGPGYRGFGHRQPPPGRGRPGGA